MTAPEKPISKALAVAETAAAAAALITDVGATGGLVAGGKLLWDGITAGLSRRRRTQAELVVELIAEALGDGDTRRLAAELESASEHPAAWDTLEEGFRAMMAAVHEDAKRCIAAVVADYLRRQSRPDRDYQLAGALLAACDLDLLRGLAALVAEREVCPDVISASEMHLGTSQNGDWMWWTNVPEPADRHVLSSHGVSSPGCFLELVQLLARNEYGRFGIEPQSAAPSAGAQSRDRGVVHLRLIKSLHLQRWQSLRLYLAPVAVE